MAGCALCLSFRMKRWLNQFRTHFLDSRAATPSIETLVHVFIPSKFIHHTHSDAILALTNQVEGEKLVEEWKESRRERDRLLKELVQKESKAR
jgi:hypothetical protein